MTRIEPLGARVLIQPIKEELKTSSGLYLPETAREKPQRGRVEAIGDPEEMTTPLEVGDVVLFAKYSGTEIRIDGTDYLLIEEGDILARIHEDE
ncbi:MAG TPA: co-chaperone GroES [Chloroflexi bacterium]|nr:co-chaperone GroES [Chloroflexota bacterium]